MKNIRYSIIAIGLFLSSLPALAQQSTKTPQASFKIATTGIQFSEDLNVYAEKHLRWLSQHVKRKGINDFTLKINKTDIYPADKSEAVSAFTISIDGIPFTYLNSSDIRNKEHALSMVKEGIMAFVQELSDEERKRRK